MEVQIGQLLDRSEILDLTHAKLIRFSLPQSNRAAFRSSFARLLASAYLMPIERRDPDAKPRLPASLAAKVRRGDFGEALAKVVYDQALPGYCAPASKLWGKPNPDTSQTGEDRIALLTKFGEALAEPVTVESKVRTTYNSPQQLLDLFRQPAEDRTRMRAAAWANTVRDLATLSEPNRDFAYLLANAMHERSSRLPADLPEYQLHGLLVVEPGSLPDLEVEKRWSNDIPPVDRLVVVEVNDLAVLVDECFDRAEELRVRDLTPDQGRPSRSVAGVSPGLTSPAAIDLEHIPALSCPVSQSAVWYLADRDGLATAAALGPSASTDPIFRALGHLLRGSLPTANSSSMDEFMATVRKAWLNPGPDVLKDAAAIADAAENWIATEPDHAERIRLVAAAVGYRLDRHPSRLLKAVAPPGTRMEALASHLVKNSLVALWPPQARAISAGLLADSKDSFVVAMPTSGGKTLLIALAIARALDTEPQRQVVVLANTRALVRQLHSGLRRWLPDVDCSQLLGELAHTGEECFPSHRTGARVVITTPERFDLDWRKAVTNDISVDPSSLTSLIVVDEAHHIADIERGARLEAGLSRARRARVPIKLFSSQLGRDGDIEAWLSSPPQFSSDWRPADVRRSTFFRSNSDTEGWLRLEGLEPELRMTMPGGAIDQADTAVAVKSRASRSAASALALASEPDGLVLVYTPQKRSVPGLADEIERRTRAASPNWLPEPRLKEIASRLPPAASRCKELLTQGIGMHHASMARFEHRAVEDAAEAGLLRYIVCTDTLLSGVDFPVRTVIATSCLRGPELLPTSHINNLAGRAGRGGRFMTGELILMTKNERTERRVLAHLAEGVPPTRSQLAVDPRGVRQARRDSSSLVLGVL